jgi:3-isopropylmalate/(R)-2-methylmalate dehydratase small subunit
MRRGPQEDGVTLHREPITRFDGRAVALPIDDIDTDQIIPARFLKTTVREGLGLHLFDGWRYEADGSPNPRFILNQPAADAASVLVAGRNFGCGSSREHAPWALADYGFRAVLAASFADIFRQNALKNGILPIVLSAADHGEVLARVLERPGAVVTVDLVDQLLRVPGDREIRFAIDPFARECLLNGVDEIGYVLRQEEAIRRYEDGLRGVRD